MKAQLFLRALLSVASESVSNNFGFIRFERGEIFLEGDLKETLKDWNNTAIKGAWSLRVNDYEVNAADILYM